MGGVIIDKVIGLYIVEANYFIIHGGFVLSND